LWCLIGILSLFKGGVHSPAVYMALALSLDAAWLLGSSAAIGVTGATLVLSFVEAPLVHTGHPLPVYFPGPPIAIWAIQVAIAALAVGPVIGLLDALRKQVSALRDSEERFRGLSDASLEGIMIHDDGVMLDTDLAFARLFGYEQPNELIGRNSLEMILSPESRVRIRERMDRKETGVMELTCVRKDGATFPAETESRPIKYHGRDARLVSCRDVTERKRAISKGMSSTPTRPCWICSDCGVPPYERL
jgi:PAS domain S-box-containing protein